jgi:tetratricopeptide (TPR) repeat protein
LKADPTHVDAASAYEEIKWQLRDFVLGCTTKVSADSLNIVDKALMVIPHDEKLTVRRNALNRLLTEQWTGEGQIALDDERFLEAISCFLKALDLDQANVDARSGLKRAHVRQSEQLRLEAAQALSEKNYVKAASFLERVAELAPNDKSVAEELQLIRAQEAFEHGMECYLSKRYPESAFQFKKTLTLDPNHKEAARHLRFAEAFARRALDSVPTAQEPVGAIASRFEALE